MIPPRGFKSEIYPLRHRLPFATALSIGTATMNTCFIPIVMSSNEMDVDADTIQVNPHHTGYEEDAGPLVRQMSILDKMRISLKFNMTDHCDRRAETSADTFTGDSIQSMKVLWRPVFGSFTDKLDAADDDTGATVASLLSLTHDATFEDVVPLTTTKLSVTGPSETLLPVSTVNAVQVFGDFNMTTDTTIEEQVWDEDLFQSALRRFTNKGALRSMVGRTRHFTLTKNRPFKNYFLDKFLPRAIRRVMPFTFFGIQVHLPVLADIEQYYNVLPTVSTAHLGIKCLSQYHEWNAEHDQDMNP